VYGFLETILLLDQAVPIWGPIWGPPFGDPFGEFGEGSIWGPIWGGWHGTKPAWVLWNCAYLSTIDYGGSMKRFVIAFTLAAAFAFSSIGYAQNLQVVNAASLTPNGSVAPGSIVTIFGLQLTTGTASAPNAANPPDTLGGSYCERW
jgi:hypothetical protein